MWNKIKNFFFVSAYQVITWVWIGLSIGAYFYNAGNKNARGVRWATLSLALSVGTMLVFIWKRIFWDSAEEPKRPELYISGARMLPLEAGKPETVVLGLRNRGNATARNIRLGRGTHIFIPSTYTGPLECKPSESDTRPDLGPDEEGTIMCPSKNPLPQSRISDLQDGRVFFFHCLEGEYEDDRGAIYPVDYCCMYSPSAPTAMRICPERFWPKDRKDRKFPEPPKLTLEKAAAFILPTQPLEVSVVLMNRGVLTAINLWLNGAAVMVPKGFERPIGPKTFTRSEYPMSLVAGTKMTATLLARTFTRQEAEAIERGDYLLFHYAVGEYADKVGRTLPIEFCLRYEPGMPYMSIADKCYWPKKQEG